MKKEGQCPLCDVTYVTRHHSRTHHHIFPVYSYGDLPLKVEVCQKCHREFNDIYDHLLKLDRKTWLVRWIGFTISKGKKPYVTYPQLRDF